MWNRRLPLDLNVLKQIAHSMCIFSRWCASTWSLMLVENFDVFPHCTHCQIEELSTSRAFIMKDWTRASMSAQQFGYHWFGFTYGLSFQCLCVVRMWKDNLLRDLKGLKQRWHSNCSPWICVASMWSFKFVQTLETLPHSIHWYMETPASSVVFERKDWTILSMAKSEHVEVDIRGVLAFILIF